MKKDEDKVREWIEKNKNSTERIKLGRYSPVKIPMYPRQ